MSERNINNLHDDAIQEYKGNIPDWELVPKEELEQKVDLETVPLVGIKEVVEESSNITEGLNTEKAVEEAKQIDAVRAEIDALMVPEIDHTIQGTEDSLDEKRKDISYFEEERKAYQDEAEIRAVEKNKNLGLLQKMKFWDRNSGAGVLQEEANEMNKRIDKERLKNPSITNQQALELAVSSAEFEHKTEQQIAIEEEAKKLGLDSEYLTAIRNHDIDALIKYKENLTYRDRINSFMERKGLNLEDYEHKIHEADFDKEKDREDKLKRKLEQKEIDEALSRGDVEAISKIRNSDVLPSIGFKEFEKIPKEVRGQEKMQDIYLKNFAWRFDKDSFFSSGYVGTFDNLKRIKKALDKFKEVGLTDQTIVTAGLREKAQERLLKILDEWNICRPEKLTTLFELYADIGLTKNADALVHDPIIQDKIKKIINTRIGQGQLGSSEKRKSLKGYIEGGYITEAEVKADPNLVRYL